MMTAARMAESHQRKAASAYKIAMHMRDVVLTSPASRPWVQESIRDARYYAHLGAIHSRTARRYMQLED